MLELPEVLTIAEQLKRTITGNTVLRVFPPSKPHKFCWFNGDPAAYDLQLAGSTVCGAEGFGIFAEISFNNGCKLCFNDGVNVRFINPEQTDCIPKDYQLLIQLADGSALAFTVAMYGGIIVHDGNYDNEYYLKSREYLLPFNHKSEGKNTSGTDVHSPDPTQDFTARYYALLAESKQSLSAKAFLATGQHFPGIGNGVLQDILFNAGISPKRKIGSLSENEQKILLCSVAESLYDMTRHGGRDTEKDLFGNTGSYKTKMSRNSIANGCPICGGTVIKETFLGGAVYYCPVCQK